MSPERRYRLLLLSYPRSYRTHRAAEMLDVLLAAERGRLGSGVAEAVSLVGHGVAMRLFRSRSRPSLPPALGLAGVSLLSLLAVLGAQQLAVSALRGLGLDGSPSAWRWGVVWVDPRWPVQALWLVTGVAVILGRNRPALVSAWTAAALHSWLLVATTVTGAELPWLGDVGPHWVVTGGLTQGSLALLSVTGAVLAGSPTRMALVRGRLPVRHARRVVVTGLAGVAMAATAGPAAYALLGSTHPRMVEALGGPVLPLVLASAVLAAGLLRVPSGAPALLLLGVLMAVPLAARWSGPGRTLGVGFVCCMAGWALARDGHRRLLAASDSF